MAGCGRFCASLAGIRQLVSGSLPRFPLVLIGGGRGAQASREEQVPGGPWRKLKSDPTLLMHSPKGSNSKKGLAVIVATSAILASSVREAAPGHQPDTFPSPPRFEELVLLEEIHAWLEPSGSDTAIGRVGAPLRDSIRAHRESFSFFVGIADRSAARIRLEPVPYGAQILEAADRHGLDPLLVAAIAQVESGFDVQAVSPRGALGLMQVMPKTAEQLGVDDIDDPSRNLEAGTRYLASLLRRFDGDLVHGLAAYNAGPTAVDRFGGLPPFRETGRFTERVLRLYIEHHRAAWIARGEEQEPQVPILGRDAGHRIST